MMWAGVQTTCALAVWLLAGSAVAADPPDLRGTWIFNPSLSDSPRQTLGGEPVQRRPRAEAGRADPPERARIRDEMRRALDGPARMTIAQDDTRVIVTADDGTTETFEPDNRARRSRTSSGVPVERRTRWDNGALVSEVSLPEGSYSQTWQRRGPLLILTTRFSWTRDGTPVVGRRVYERRPQHSP